MEKIKNQFPLLEKELSYWKAHITIYDVLADELSYSMLYDNIRPDKVKEALGSVGLTMMPNRFLLIQVDDYQNYASKLRLTQECFQKTSLIKVLRECMKSMEVQGFIANLIGQDNFICFLCCQEKEGPEIKEYLLRVTQAFQRAVRSRGTYTISVCVSGECSRMVQYSQMYPNMHLALSKTYFEGKEFIIYLDEMLEESKKDTGGAYLNEYYPALLASISRQNEEQFEQAMQSIIKMMLESHALPQKIRLEMVRLIQRIEEYCVQCGVPKDRIAPYTEETGSHVLACSFVADVMGIFRDYYHQAVQAVEEYRVDDGYSFRRPVEVYIAEHYQNTIRLGDVAALLGFSEGHFARVFRQSFGVSFIQYLTEYRLNQSRYLLSNTGISIDQIADRVGINSYSYFCTCFKRRYGISPGSYRKRHARSGVEGEVNQERNLKT